MNFLLNLNYIIISYLFLSGLIILQTIFKSSSVILVLRWTKLLGDQTAWRPNWKEKKLFIGPSFHLPGN